MMWTCGLRGAVAYALAVNMPTSNRAIETTTLFIVLCTTLLFGCSTGPLLKALGLDSETPTLPGHLLASGVKRDQREDWGPRSVPHQIFKWVDRAYLKPVFGGRIEGDLEEPWLNDDERYSEGNLSGRRSFMLEDTLSSDDEFRAPEVTLFTLSSPSSRDAKFDRYQDLPNGDHQ